MKQEVNICDICKKQVAKSKCEICEEDICGNCQKTIGISLVDGDFDSDDSDDKDPDDYANDCDYKDDDDECDSDCKNCEHYDPDDDDDCDDDCTCLGVVAPISLCEKCFESVEGMKLTKLKKDNQLKDIVLPTLKKYVILDKLKPKKKKKS